MNNRKTMSCIIILSLTCLGSQNIVAGTVYQWTDEAGNINFSDVAPADSVLTKTLEISINDSNQENVDLEKYSIINQAKLMAEWRRQITEERLEKKRLMLEEKRLAYEMELSNQNEDVIHQANISYGYPYYSYLPNRYHRHLGHKAGLHRPHVKQRQSHMSFGRNISHRSPRQGSFLGMNSKRF